MPSAVVKSFAKASNKKIEEVEKLWIEAKVQAEKTGHKNDYAYITSILKKMLHLDKSSKKVIEEDGGIGGVSSAGAMASGSAPIAGYASNPYKVDKKKILQLTNKYK